MPVFPGVNFKLENKFSKYTKSENVLSFCNGTSAIEAALFAIGVGPGDEVVVPSCTFHASIDPICNLGAKPVFADVDSNTFTLCPEDLKTKVSDKTKAIVVTHLFGIPADMKSICEIANGKNIDIVEDVSHAHGARANGKLCGTIGRIGAFSLQGGKAVAAGEGGIVVAKDRKDLIRMSLFGHYDLHQENFHEIHSEAFKDVGMGHKRRMSALNSFLAMVDLQDLESTNKIMRKNSLKLENYLASIEGLRFPRLPKDSIKGGFFLGFPINLVDTNLNAKKLIEKLKTIGVHATAYPYVFHHKLAIYLDMDYRNEVLRNREDSPIASPQNLSEYRLKNTEALQDNLVIIPRRYLISLGGSGLKRLAYLIEQEVRSA